MKGEGGRGMCERGVCEGGKGGGELVSVKGEGGRGICEGGGSVQRGRGVTTKLCGGSVWGEKV